jgi:hypothetical protein
MPRKRNKYDGLDIDAVTCLDLGHKWSEVFFGRADYGILRGMPIRIVRCTTCYSERLDHLTWDGHVTSRNYHSDPAYIDNIRALNDDQHLRRRALREAKAERMREEGNRGEFAFDPKKKVE